MELLQVYFRYTLNVLHLKTHTKHIVLTNSDIERNVHFAIKKTSKYSLIIA